MNKLISNIDYVINIKQKLFLQNLSFKDLNCLIDENAIIESPANFNQEKGAKGLISAISYWKKAFPNVKSKWITEHEKDDSTVIINWEAEGNHTGVDFFGIKPKGNLVTYVGQTTYLFNDHHQLIRYQVAIDLEAIKAQLTD